MCYSSLFKSVLLPLKTVFTRCPIAMAWALTGRKPTQKCVKQRPRADGLFYELEQRLETETDYQPESLSRIGDCEAPSIIAGAVYSGHRYARELDTEVDPDNRMKYDRVFFEDE
jgi:hypothetical protein